MDPLYYRPSRRPICREVFDMMVPFKHACLAMILMALFIGVLGNSKMRKVREEGRQDGFLIGSTRNDIPPPSPDGQGPWDVCAPEPCPEGWPNVAGDVSIDLLKRFPDHHPGPDLIETALQEAYRAALVIQARKRVTPIVDCDAGNVFCDTISLKEHARIKQDAYWKGYDEAYGAGHDDWRCERVWKVPEACHTLETPGWFACPTEQP
jgi:hypothetical protein